MSNVSSLDAADAATPRETFSAGIRPVQVSIRSLRWVSRMRFRFRSGIVHSLHWLAHSLPPNRTCSDAGAVGGATSCPLAAGWGILTVNRPLRHSSRADSVTLCAHERMRTHLSTTSRDMPTEPSDARTKCHHRFGMNTPCPACNTTHFQAGWGSLHTLGSNDSRCRYPARQRSPQLSATSNGASQTVRVPQRHTSTDGVSSKCVVEFDSVTDTKNMSERLWPRKDRFVGRRARTRSCKRAAAAPP